jgi:hypothetical protein
LRRTAALVACVVATIAFSVYARTLLPGVDLGDTGGFQAAVLWPETSARQAYPLYFGLARPFVLAFSPDNPARGLNLFSALCGGLSAGLLTYLAALLMSSALAGAIAGSSLAFSYTFWTQSVIAEVYTLHIALVCCCLLALHAFTQHPSLLRLALFFAVYAVSFGNHLSMILLLVPFALFLWVAHPQPRELVRPRTIAMAVGIVLAATLLYAPEFLFVWTNIDAPARWADRIAIFWFDVTKADWRGTMMAGVDPSELRDRVAMWAWDARLQFGLAGLVVALIGAGRLWVASRAWSVLIVSAYLVNTIFAVTYNVGDPHVFFLPGHALTALAIAALFADRRGRSKQVTIAAAIVLLAHTSWRAWDTWPSADRHGDRRADTLVARVAAGVSDTNAVLLSDMDWQAENALLYSARYVRRQLAWKRLSEVLLHFPSFVEHNQTIGRDIVLAGNAASRVAAAYGALFPIAPDRVPPIGIAGQAAAIPRGTPYVLVLLKPTPEERLDVDDFDEAVTALAGASAPRRTGNLFQVWAGLAGERGVLYQASDRPFRKTFSILGDPFSVRMESWLPFETFRRAGFGHVLRGREAVLTIERGVSLVWFEREDAASVTYAAGLYAPKPRLRIPALVPQQVARRTGGILELAQPTAQR